VQQAPKTRTPKWPQGAISAARGYLSQSSGHHQNTRSSLAHAHCSTTTATNSNSNTETVDRWSLFTKLHSSHIPQIKDDLSPLPVLWQTAYNVAFCYSRRESMKYARKGMKWWEGDPKNLIKENFGSLIEIRKQNRKKLISLLKVALKRWWRGVKRKILLLKMVLASMSIVFPDASLWHWRSWLPLSAIPHNSPQPNGKWNSKSETIEMAKAQHL
jgi:hypothetical protein